MACTLTVELPDDVYEVSVRIAQKAKATPEGLVSEWVKRKVQLIQNDPLEEVIGTIEGGVRLIGWSDMMNTSHIPCPSIPLP